MSQGRVGQRQGGSPRSLLVLVREHGKQRRPAFSLFFNAYIDQNAVRGAQYIFFLANNFFKAFGLWHIHAGQIREPELQLYDNTLRRSLPATVRLYFSGH